MPNFRKHRIVLRMAGAFATGSVLFGPLGSLANADALIVAPSIRSAETHVEKSLYTIDWTVSVPGTPVDIFASPTPDAALPGLRRVAYHVTSGSISLPAPFATSPRTYFYVRPEAAIRGLWTASRVVALTGASNFRDLGGYATSDQHHVRWGELYRSNGLSELTPADYGVVDGLGIKLVCDLRTLQEQNTQPTIWQGQRPDFVRSSKPRVDIDFKKLFGTGTPEAPQIRSRMIGFYRTMPDLYAPEMQAMFARLLRGEVPMIVHCSAGKDRTGLASALILSALGVPRPTIDHDYAMSGPLLEHAQKIAAKGQRKPDPTAAMFAKLPPQIIHVLLASDPAYIEGALDSATREYGSVDAYLEKRLGVGKQQRAALRQRYLE